MTWRGPRESPQPLRHQFTVRRGMTVVLVIETTYWYAGLLQAALARIAVEGRIAAASGNVLASRCDWRCLP